MPPPVISAAFACLLAVISAGAQQPATTTGQFNVSGRAVSYQIRRLPLSAFPDLPPAVSSQLAQRDCLIPQTYEARRPENVVHASLQSSGSNDWAVLCSAGGVVSLLVFFEQAPDRPITLASALETQRLQLRFNGELGFNWGIDPATPEQVRIAQIGLNPRPTRLDHDALADSVIDHTTLYHYFNGAWLLLEMP